MSHFNWCNNSSGPSLLSLRLPRRAPTLLQAQKGTPVWQGVKGDPIQDGQGTSASGLGTPSPSLPPTYAQGSYPLHHSHCPKMGTGNRPQGWGQPSPGTHEGDLQRNRTRDQEEHSEVRTCRPDRKQRGRGQGGPRLGPGGWTRAREQSQQARDNTQGHSRASLPARTEWDNPTRGNEDTAQNTRLLLAAPECPTVPLAPEADNTRGWGSLQSTLSQRRGLMAMV